MEKKKGNSCLGVILGYWKAVFTCWGGLPGWSRSCDLIVLAVKIMAFSSFG